MGTMKLSGKLRAGEENSVDRTLLPQAFVTLDEVRIEFAPPHS